MNSCKRLAIALATAFLLLLVVTGPLFAESEDLVLARIDITNTVTDLTMPVYAYLQDAAGRDYVLVMATVPQLDKSNTPYEFLDLCDNKSSNQAYFIALERRQGARGQAGSIADVLHDDGRHLIVCTTPEQAEALALIGFDIEMISTPMIFRENKLEVAAVAYNPLIAEMVAKVQQQTLYNYTGGLSGEVPVTVGGSQYTIVSRYTKAGEPMTKATQYAYEFMQKFGYTVSYHDWQSWSGSSRNVIANKLGTTKPKEIILVTAHFDSMPSSATNSPGADDNASGSVGVMLAAEIFSKYRFERTIRFALFTGEEQGLLGSAAYATKVAQDGENIVAVYNMDMIAFDSKGGPTLRLHTRTTSSPGYSADKAMVDLFSEVIKLYNVNLSPILDADGITASDHASFWRKGFTGILAIEDDADDFCSNYHTSKDKLATLNMPYFTNYVKATFGTVAHLAGPVQ